MENQNQTIAAKKRKFLLVLPVLILPFITMIFWALGGGTANASQGKETRSTGINAKLPDASLRDEKGLDKMSFYDQAQKDSAKTKGYTGSGNGPVLTGDSNTSGAAYPGQLGVGSNITMNTSPYGGPGFNSKEDKINQRLQQLNYAMNAPQAEPQLANGPYSGGYQNGYNSTAESLQRLEKMMQQMQTTSPEEDKETAQLNGLLEKVLDIQNPERVREKIRKSSMEHKGQVFAVTAAQKREVISLLNTTVQKGAKEPEGNGFFSLENERGQDLQQNTVSAAIHQTQTVVNGSTVKLRLLDDVYINGRLIPKNTFAFGEASLNGERLSIKITGIQFKKSQYPVELSVYDVDGMDGIYIPGAIARDVAKQSADRAIQGIQFDNMNPSFGAQAASAGIEAAKSLFSRKIKLISVTIRAGYNVLLIDDKQKQKQSQ